MDVTERLRQLDDVVEIDMAISEITDLRQRVKLWRARTMLWKAIAKLYYSHGTAVRARRLREALSARNTLVAQIDSWIDGIGHEDEKECINNV